MGWQWHQLDDMQIICTSPQTDNHTSTTSLNFFTGQMLFLPPHEQCQSIGTSTLYLIPVNSVARLSQIMKAVAPNS